MTEPAGLHIAWKDVILPLILIGFTNAAHAQGVDTEPADTAGNRQQPAYDALGIRRGPFMIKPEVAISAGYNSNLFARETDAVSDFSTTITPSVRVTYDRPRARVSFSADTRLRRYAEQTDQNDQQYKAALDGNLSLDHATQLSGNIGWSRATVARGTSENGLQSGSPLEQTSLTAAARLNRRFNRVGLNLSLSGERFLYSDVTLEGGGVLDQSFREGHTLGGTAGLSYDVGPRFAFVARAEFADFHYRDPRPETNRNARDYALTAGGRFELTELLFAELTAGYRTHDFSGETFADFSGLAINGRLRWYPSRLLSLRADLGQRVTTSSFDNVSAVTITSARLGGDYELRRNILLSGRVELSHERYSGIGGNSLRTNLNSGFKWKSNRWLQFGGSVEYERRSRSIEAIFPKYDGIRVFLNATVAR